MSPGNVERIINKYAEKIRPEHPELPAKVHPHMLRRTRATNLYQSDVELELVSRILGHASTQTTRIYAKPSLEMIKSAMDRSNPELNAEQPLWPDDEVELARIFESDNYVILIFDDKTTVFKHIFRKDEDKNILSG